VRGGFSCILCHSLISALGHWGCLPWGNFDILLNRKGSPIKVTVIGHPLLHQSCIHLLWALGKYKLCDNIFAPLPGNTKSIFLNDTFSVSLYLKAFILQNLPGDSIEGDPLIPLIVSRKLSGDSTKLREIYQSSQVLQKKASSRFSCSKIIIWRQSSLNHNV
jgi:hypothetical protein